MNDLDLIKKHWPTRRRTSSSMVLGTIASRLFGKGGLTHEQVKDIFEDAIDNTIHDAEFDRVMVDAENK